MHCSAYITSQAGLAGLLFLRGFDQAATCVCHFKHANTAFQIGNIFFDAKIMEMIPLQTDSGVIFLWIWIGKKPHA